MGNYVLGYKGGAMAETPEAQEAAMAAWGAFFAGLGSAVVEVGNPFGPATTVKADRSTSPLTGGLTGYSVVQADSLELAAKLTEGCPLFEAGGTVEVYETIDVM